MKALYFISTLSFWLIITGLWFVHTGSSVSGQGGLMDQATRFSMAEVAEHDREDDCWMVIHGQVYDLSEYLPLHPTSLQVILPSCGKEASEAYDTKNYGRPHSPGAHDLLADYWVGVLQE